MEKTTTLLCVEISSWVKIVKEVLFLVAVKLVVLLKLSGNLLQLIQKRFCYSVASANSGSTAFILLKLQAAGAPASSSWLLLGYLSSNTFVVWLDLDIFFEHGRRS